MRADRGKHHTARRARDMEINQQTKETAFWATSMLAVALFGIGAIIALALAVLRSCRFIKSIVEIAFLLVIGLSCAVGAEYVLRENFSVNWREYYEPPQHMTEENTIYSLAKQYFV